VQANNVRLPTRRVPRIAGDVPSGMPDWVGKGGDEERRLGSRSTAQRGKWYLDDGVEMEATDC